MSRLRDLHEKWLDEPEYREEYERLGPEFELAHASIEARAGVGLTQAKLATRTGTTTRKRDEKRGLTSISVPDAEELSMADNPVVVTEVRPIKGGLR